jgi:hypothetical protein
MRPPIGTNCWLRMVSSIALVVVIFSASIRTPQPPGPRVHHDVLCRNFPLVSDGSGPAFTSATSDPTSVDPDHPDCQEEDDDESFWSFSHLACFISIPPDLPSKLLSGPRPGTSPLRTAAVPQRC